MSDLSPFYGQFALVREPLDRLEDWSVATCRGWTLAAHPALPAVELTTRDGSHVGWFVGFVVNPDGELVDAARVLPFETPADVTADAVDAFIYAHGGRFVCAVLSEKFSALYLDCAGNLAAVYSVDERIVASTSSLLACFSREKARTWDLPPGFPGPNQFYPGGLTADPGIRRVIPNHYLDLDRWRPVRHWLNAASERVEETGVAEQIDVIVENTRKSVHAVTSRYHTYMGLSAGRDSRMILACSRAALDRMTFVTYTYNWLNADMYMGRTLARRFGFDQRIVPTKAPTAELREQYLLRTGWAGNSGKARDIYHANARYLDTSSAFFIGYGGEVGRAFFWPHVDGPSLPELGRVLSWMPLPDIDIFRDALEQWLDELPPLDVHALVDQLYLEQRQGCWAGPHMYGIASFALTLAPLCHRDTFDAMLRLPVAYRKKQRMADDVIRAAWPELGALPFQTMPGWLEAARRVSARIIPAR
jgi:hypothetical protein